MNDELNIPLPQSEPPDDALLRRISAQLAASSPKGVRPLPSNAVLLTTALAVFACLSLVLAAFVKFKAIAVLSAGEMASYYGIVGLLAVLFAHSIVERIIPGEKRVIPTAFLLGATFVALMILMSMLFSDHSTERFVASGLPCLVTGVISATVGGFLGWRLLRKGYWVSPRETVLLYCSFAGLVGVAVLALHCPIRNSLHCLVWHLGALVLSGAVGLVLGRYFENAD